MTLMRRSVLAALLLLAGCAGGTSETATTSGTGSTAAAPATQGPAPGSEADLVANAGDRVYFAFDRSSLDGTAQATLDRQAAWLQAHPDVHVLIAGNTDERGTEEYNIALGQRRANAVRDYLEAKGIPASRISTTSFGRERPQPDALCAAESCYARNRNAITSVEGGPATG